MTLFFRLPCLLGALGIALLGIAPIAYAAELEGTPVPIDGSVPIAVPAPAPDVVPVPPPADSNEHEQSQHEQQDFAREQQDFVREQNDFVREQQEHAREQAEHANEIAAQVRGDHDWEHNWEKNLSKAFDGEGDGDSLNLALLIPILAVLFIFGGPVILLILILVFFFGAKRRRQRDINMNIDKLLAAGRDIPIELLRGDEPRAAVEIGSRDKGIRNIFLGAGWLVFLTVLVGFHIGAAGLIWIALGVSQVLIWHLNTNVMPAKTGDSQAGQQD